jgi:sugar fermentation stimulation protein A
VTLAEPDINDLIGYFPDAVTIRGQKHLRELIAMVASGCRAVLFFSVQHKDISQVRVAEHIDAKYAGLLREAVKAGVEVIAYQALLSSKEMKLDKRIPFLL